MGDEVISVAGPRTWNKLPLDTRQSTNMVTCEKKLKTPLFDTV